jgi:hypothetical protein
MQKFRKLSYERFLSLMYRISDLFLELRACRMCFRTPTAIECLVKLRESQYLV